jgi:chromosome segregation ATPase
METTTSYDLKHKVDKLIQLHVAAKEQNSDLVLETQKLRAIIQEQEHKIGLLMGQVGSEKVKSRELEENVTELNRMLSILQEQAEKAMALEQENKELMQVLNEGADKVNQLEDLLTNGIAQQEHHKAALRQSVSELEQRLQNNTQQLDEFQKKEASRGEETLKLNGTIDEQKNLIKDLEEKISIIKLAKATASEDGEKNTDVKLKINEMVREIDKCLSLLNK